MPRYFAWCPDRCDESDAIEIRSDYAIEAAEEYAEKKDNYDAEVTAEMRVFVRTTLGEKLAFDVFSRPEIRYSAKPAKGGA